MQKIETNQLLEKILDELQSLSKKIDELTGELQKSNANHKAPTGKAENSQPPKKNKLTQNISDAVKFLEKNSVSFQVVDMKSGHFHVYPLDGSLIQYWAGTGTIVSAEGRKDAKGLNALLSEIKSKELC